MVTHGCQKRVCWVGQNCATSRVSHGSCHVCVVANWNTTAHSGQWWIVVYKHLTRLVVIGRSGHG